MLSVKIHEQTKNANLNWKCLLIKKLVLLYCCITLIRVGLAISLVKWVQALKLLYNGNILSIPELFCAAWLSLALVSNFIFYFLPTPTLCMEKSEFKFCCRKNFIHRSLSTSTFSTRYFKSRTHWSEHTLYFYSQSPEQSWCFHDEHFVSKKHCFNR